MKLLIVTQKVDRADPILGFFHRWIEEFAKHCESVVVIAQSVGDFSLPHNVNVESLKKEEGLSRIAQVLRFRKLLKSYRNDFDAAFVHMTPIWVVLGWPWLRPVYLWYEARGSRWPLRVALWVVRKVFSASVHGMPVQTSKGIVTGHGIDTDVFCMEAKHRDPRLLVTVGRITPAKRLHLIVDVMRSMPSDYRLTIAGTTITTSDHRYRIELEESLQRHRVEIRPVPHSEIVPLLHRAILFLHASQTSLDKALLEAMACGCLVVSCSDAARGLLPPPCVATPETFADRAQELLARSPEEQDTLRRALRQIVVEGHSLPRLIDRLVKEMR